MRYKNYFRIPIFAFVFWIVLLSLISCDFLEEWNDDFAPQSSFSRELNEHFTNGSINILSNIIPDANHIASRYADDLNLVEIVINSLDAGISGNIQFIYTKVHEFRNRMTRIDVYFNIEDLKFYRIDYISGSGRQVSGRTTKMNDTYLNVPISRLFETTQENVSVFRVTLFFDNLQISVI